MSAGAGRGSISRREFLGVTGAVAVGAGLGAGGSAWVDGHGGSFSPDASGSIEPFFGNHQGGIATPAQSYSKFATFDLITDKRSDVGWLLKAWTEISARLTSGQPSARPTSPNAPQADSGEAVGLPPARLTVNVGFGSGLFSSLGTDRFGLRDRAPVPLVELPSYPCDRMSRSSVGGDLTVHACSDDPQVAFHAVRQLARAGRGMVRPRWTQSGFSPPPRHGDSPRNLLGFKDGTVNPSGTSEMDVFVWVGEEGPDWMTGGTYLVARRIRVDLERWDLTSLATQEMTIGRYKASGGPLSGSKESDPLDLSARTLAGSPVIPLNSHVRLASPEANWGSKMLRRSFSYDNGTIDEHGTSVSDAGTFFACYQRYPEVAFVPIFRKLADEDALTPFTVHTASAIAAIPAGAAEPGDWIGRLLLDG